MSDIDKRLAIAIIESSDGWITFDTKSGYAYNQEYDFPMKKIVKAIKQLMADEFEKMIKELNGSDWKKPINSDELRQKLKEWKK